MEALYYYRLSHLAELSIHKEPHLDQYFQSLLTKKEMSNLDLIPKAEFFKS